MRPIIIKYQNVTIINKNSLVVSYNNLYNQVSFVGDNDFDSRGVCDIIYSAQRVILVLCKLGNMWVQVIDNFFVNVSAKMMCLF